jgi:anti-sigma-K factor RskA
MAEDPHSLVAPYALDALDEHERRRFEEHLATCERCREELSGLREAAADLAYGAVGPPPPPALRERILERARAERDNVVSLPGRRRSWTTPLAAAAAVAAAVALGVGVWSATRPSASDPFAAILARPGAKVVAMGDRGAVAVAPDGDAALALSVPSAPSGKTYEAWVIEGGTPRRAGLFEGGGGTAVVDVERPVGKGAVVAVTLERAGGVERPTRQPLAATRAIS